MWDRKTASQLSFRLNAEDLVQKINAAGGKSGSISFASPEVFQIKCVVDNQIISPGSAIPEGTFIQQPGFCLISEFQSFINSHS